MNWRKCASKMSDPAPRCVTAHGYDLMGNGTGRIFRHLLRSKWMPFGNFGGGPGFKAILITTVIQRGGWLLGWLVLSLEPRLRRWLGWWHRRRAATR